MHQAPGTLVTPDVRLVAPLGEGAMGTLWVAEHLGLGTRVAVKFVAHKLVGDVSALARFRREAEAAAQLRSSHAVRTIDYGTMDGGAPYIVMELLEGETLGTRLRRTRCLGLQQTARVVRHVAEALGEAHGLGIVHRDIKADNIFLVHSPAGLLAKVLDFGMAKHQASRAGSLITATGVIVGTPEYMSPEQVLGSKHVDHRADLWALGVVAYRSLFGRMPFTGETPHALVFNICKGALQKPSELGLPRVLDAWFERALAPQLDGRFEAAALLSSAFEQAVTETDRLGFGQIDLSELSSMPGSARSWEAQAAARAGAAPARDSSPELDVSGPDSSGLGDDGALAATVAVQGIGERLLDGDTLERVVPGAAAPDASPGEPATAAAWSKPAPESRTAERLLPRPSVPGPAPSARESVPSSPRARPAPSSGGAPPWMSSPRRRSSVGLLATFAAMAAAGAAFVIGRAWLSGAGEASTTSATDSPRVGAPAAAGSAMPVAGGGAHLPELRAGPNGSGAAAHGSLSLVCEPRCEQVLVDDWARGPSPLTGLELPAGDHRVTLKRGDRPPKVIHVEIVAGEEAMRVVSMALGPDGGIPSAVSTSAATEPSAPPAASGAGPWQPQDL
jgi:eukaryotic-like serine/threonine-protein kinase